MMCVRDGAAYVGPAHVGPAHVGPAYVGPAYVGPAHVGPAYVGPAQNDRSFAVADSTIELLDLPPSDVDIRDLAALLVDAVDSGAAVSFLAPLDQERAQEWWRSVTTRQDARPVILVARDPEGIAGTVQLVPAWAPNQPHRAEIAKLIVHRRARGAGLGEALMRAIEHAAKDMGLRLLTLDAKRGAAAESLYRRLGWVYVGTIPRFALDPDGTTLHDDVLFYKELTD